MHIRLRENNNSIPQVQEVLQNDQNNNGVLRINLENRNEINYQERGGNNDAQDLDL